MKKNMLKSDHIKEWSDIYEKSHYFLSKTKEEEFIKKNKQYCSRDFTWLTCRTVQALQQTWLQVSKRKGTRTQVLYVYFLSKEKDRAGLHSSAIRATSEIIFRQFQKIKAADRRHLCNKPRTAKKTGKTIVIFFHTLFIYGPLALYRCYRNFGCKYGAITTDY